MELSAAIGEAASRSARVDPEHEGWTEVVIPIESVDHAAAQLLSIGADAQVLEPAGLRNRMKTLIGAFAALYAD